MPRAGTARVAGVEFDIEPAADRESAEPAREPGELFPDRNLRAARPLTKEEEAHVATYCSIRDSIRAGPLWTGPGSAMYDEYLKSKNKKTTAGGKEPANAITDPFEHGVETYSQKYTQKKPKANPFLGQTHMLKHLPRELWDVIDPKYAESEGPARKKAKLDTKKAKAKLDAALDKAENKDGEDDAAAVHSDEEPVEEIVDDEFEEDEDDMAGDYNAEKYFEDGGDDAGEDYYGGDGGDDGES